MVGIRLHGSIGCFLFPFFPPFFSLNLIWLCIWRQICSLNISLSLLNILVKKSLLVLIVLNGSPWGWTLIEILHIFCICITLFRNLLQMHDMSTGSFLRLLGTIGKVPRYFANVAFTMLYNFLLVAVHYYFRFKLYQDFLFSIRYH